MAVAIARLYNDGGVGLLEAGTGVGKSLGYLVPALRWAAANSERTVVSTNTINLQEQLVGKDLPVSRSARFPIRRCGSRCSRAGETISVSCGSQLARSSGNALFEDGVQQELDTIQTWSERTPTDR